MLDGNVLAFDESSIVETLPERGKNVFEPRSRRGPKKSNHRHRRLLGARRARPRRSATEQRDELATADHSITSSARFRARLRIARCEVRYNREKVLLVEIGYNLGHQRAPFSRSGAVLEVIELPEHVAR